MAPLDALLGALLATAAPTRTIALHPGETQEIQYPPGTDLAVSRRGIVDLFPAEGGRWELTALRPGFVVVDARDGATGESRLPRLLVDVRAASPPGALEDAPAPAVPPWICRTPGVMCDVSAGLVSGSAPTYAWLRQARSACRPERGCRLETRLTPDSRDEWARSLRAVLGADYTVEATDTGWAVLTAFCAGNPARRQDEADLLTGRALSDGAALLRCSEASPEARYRLALRLWQVEESAARELGLAPEAQLTLDTGGEAGGRLLARLGALEREQRAEVLGQPVLRLSAGRPAELAAGGEFLVEDRRERAGRATGPSDLSLWKQTGLAAKVLATPAADGRVRIAFELTLRSRDDGAGKSLALSTLKSEVDVRPGEPVMAGLLDVQTSGASTASLPLLSRIPIVGPLFGGRGTRSTRSRLLLWLELADDVPAGALAPPSPLRGPDAP